MKTQLNWRAGIRFATTTSSGSAIQIDGPPNIGGKGGGARPMELMLMGIGACTAVDVMHMLHKTRCNVVACTTKVSATRAAEHPQVFEQIRIHFLLAGSGLTERKVERAIALSKEKYCSASIMMQRAGVDVSYEWEFLPNEEDSETESTAVPPMMGLHHIALFSEHYEASRDFYIECMGLDVEWEPDNDNVYLSSGRDNLAIHRCQSSESRSDTKLDHIGFVVEEEKHVDTWFDYLKSKDVDINGEPKSHRDGARSFYAFDPNGTKVQIIYHPPLVGAL